MTEEEVKLFRTRFKSIVYQLSSVKKAEAYVKELSRFDRKGSHQKAINKAREILDIQRGTLEVMLQGRSYEDWKEASAKISKYQSRMKRSDQVRKRVAIELGNFEFAIVSRETISLNHEQKQASK